MSPEVADEVVGGWAAHIVGEWKYWSRGDLEKYIHEIRNSVLEESAGVAARVGTEGSAFVNVVDVLGQIERLVSDHDTRRKLRGAIEGLQRYDVPDLAASIRNGIRALKRPVALWPHAQ